MVLPSLSQPKVPTPTGDDIERQLQNQSRLKGIGRVLRKLGLMRLEDTEDVGLTNLKVLMGKVPQAILGGLRQIGRNPDSETFLRSLKPDIDDAGLNTIFGSSPVPPPPVEPPPEPPIKLSQEELQRQRLSLESELARQGERTPWWLQGTEEEFQQKMEARAKPAGGLVTPPPPPPPLTPAEEREIMLPTLTPAERREAILRESFQPQKPLAEIIGEQLEASRTIPAEEAIRRIQEQGELPIEEWLIPTEDWLDRAREIGKNPVQLVPFLSTAVEFITLSNVNRVANALEAGEAVSETELRLLTNFINKANRDTTWGYKVMDVIAQMPAFAGEVAATGGIFTGTRVAAQKAGTTALKKLIGQAIERRIAQTAIRGGAGAVAAGVAGIPAAFARTPAGIQERQLIGTLTGDEESVWESAAKAFGASWVETASERTGGALGALTGPVKGQLVKSAFLRSILRLNPGRTSDDVNKLLQKFGYNGVFGEMFEERVADVGHGLLAQAGLGDEPFKLPSLEQLSIELAAFAVPGVAAQVVSNLPEAIGDISETTKRLVSETGATVPGRGGQPEGAKEPWQMTKQEYVKAVNDKRASTVLSLPEDEVMRRMLTLDEQGRPAGHKAVIQRALSEGKPVPAEVLKDYPDLKPVTPTAPVTPVPEVTKTEFQQRLIAAQDLAKEASEQKYRIKPNADGSVTIYHGTSSKNAKNILSTGKIERQTFFSPNKVGATYYGKTKAQRGEILSIKVDARDIEYSTGTSEIFAPGELVKDVDGIWKSPKRVALPEAQPQDIVQPPAEPPVVSKAELPQVLPPPPPVQPPTPRGGGVPTPPKPTQVQRVREFYKEKIADMKGATADKIASLKDWANYNITERQRVKGILVDYINKNLPLRERGRLITAVKNVKDQKGLDSFLVSVDQIAEVTSQRRLKAAIVKELKSARPKKVEGIVKGRFGGDIQAELDIMNRSLKMTRDEALAGIVGNQQAYEDGKMTYEDMIRNNSRLSFMGIEGMTATELQETLDYIKTLKEVGRAIRTQELEKWKAGIDTAKTEITRVITGGKEIEPGVVKEFTRLKSLAKRVEGGQVALTDFLDILSGTDKSSKPYSSALNLFVDDRVLKSYNAEQDGVELIRERINENFQRIFNVEKDREANDILRRMGKEKVNVGTFKDTEGKSVALVMTKGQMIDAYNLMQAEENLPTFTEGNKWTPEMRQAVTDSLTAQEKAWADWQREFLADYWISINEVYEPLYGVKLGRNPNYWPRKRDVERSDVPEHILVQEDYNHFASVNNGSLKARTENKIPFKFMDANTKLISHVTQMEHFKAWAFTIRDLRSVFMSKDIKNAIRQFYGQDIGGKIDDFINVMARGGIEKARRNHVVDAIRGRVAVSVLGLKPGIALKQPLALLGYATEMPYADFATGVVDYLKNPVKNYRTLYAKSSSLRARYRAGQYERDIKVGVEGGAIRNISGKANWKENVLTLISLGDKFGTVPGMWAKYQSELKAGATDAQAILEAEKLTNKTQNTSQLFTQSTIQHGGSWARLLTMFQDQPNKYFRLLNSNFRNMLNGRQGKAKSISNIILLWVVMPALFQWMSDAFQFKPERQARAVILGPVNYLLIFGQMAQSVVGWITGEKFPYQPSPVLEIADDIQIGISKIMKLLRDGQDPTKDVTMDDIVEMAERFVKVGGLATGIPTPYLVQVEKALRGQVDKKGNRAWDLRELIFSRWALEGDADPFGEAKKGIPKAIDNLGKTDVVGRDDALIDGVRKGLSQARMIELENKEWNYDIQALRRDIQAMTEKVSEKDRAKLEPIVSEYWQFKEKKDEFALLSDKEQEQYVKDNPDYTTNRLFWGDSNLTTIPDLKTAEALEVKAKQFNIPLDMIPAFQLTDKGKERIPSDESLWSDYFDYYDLPGSSYLNLTQVQVDAGKLPEKYRKEWETYHKLKTDAAKDAFKKYRNKKGQVAYGGWRDDFRRANKELDKWLQENKDMKPLKKGRTSKANIRPQSASSLFGGFSRPSSRRKKLAMPKFPKSRVLTGAGAPRVPRV